MPQHPTARHPVPTREPASTARSTSTRSARESTPQIPEKAPDLTVNKVLAGAGAAATSAVLGSVFGAAGTVLGAALGSVASTIAATLYQRSLDRTRDTLVARIRVVGARGVDAAGGSAGELTVPMQRLPAEDATRRLRVEPVVAPRAPRRRIVLAAAATVLIFALGMLAVTGLEWLKGSTITHGESGTSVGRVLDPGAGAAAEDTESTPTPEPSSEPEPTTEPTDEPAPSADQESDGSEPTGEPDAGSETGSDGGDGTDSEQDQVVPLDPDQVLPGE